MSHTAWEKEQSGRGMREGERKEGGRISEEEGEREENTLTHHIIYITDYIY